MKFYDRETEIQELMRIDELAQNSAQLTVLIGRRRTGKTTLMVRAFGQEVRTYTMCRLSATDRGGAGAAHPRPGHFICVLDRGDSNL